MYVNRNFIIFNQPKTLISMTDEQIDLKFWILRSFLHIPDQLHLYKPLSRLVSLFLDFKIQNPDLHQPPSLRK